MRKKLLRIRKKLAKFSTKFSTKFLTGLLSGSLTAFGCCARAQLPPISNPQEVIVDNKTEKASDLTFFLVNGDVAKVSRTFVSDRFFQMKDVFGKSVYEPEPKAKEKESLYSRLGPYLANERLYEIMSMKPQCEDEIRFYQAKIETRVKNYQRARVILKKSKNELYNLSIDRPTNLLFIFHKDTGYLRKIQKVSSKKLNKITSDPNYDFKF